MSLRSASWKEAHTEALKKLILESGVKVTSSIAKELDPVMFKDFLSRARLDATVPVWRRQSCHPEPPL